MLRTSDKIKHLHWRSGFGLSPEEWKLVKDQPFQNVLDQLFAQANSAGNISTAFQERIEKEFKKLDKEERKLLLKREKELIREQNFSWLKRMADPKESALLEKMCLFWHGHFACVTKASKLASQQLKTIRKHALGNFRSFVHAMAKDVSMIRFLNNQQNRKRQPNENFTRELLELFTIGRGHYSEQDIKEAARAFTGWSSDFKGDFKFKKRHHDFGEKTFMNKSGAFDGGDIIDMILDRPETAEFITRKVYRFFVSETVDERLVSQLAKRFYNSNYDIKDLMYTIFSSDWFYNPALIGNQIKSPVVLLAGIMRSLQVRFDNANPVLFIERALGQILFKPPNVAGWAGGKNWIDNSTLMLRLNLSAYLFQAVDISFKTKEEFEAKKRNKTIRKIKASVNLSPLLNQYTSKSETVIFVELSKYFVQSPMNMELSKFQPFLSQNSKKDFIQSLVIRLMSLPEYQVC